MFKLNIFQKLMTKPLRGTSMSEVRPNEKFESVIGVPHSQGEDVRSPGNRGERWGTKHDVEG